MSIHEGCSKSSTRKRCRPSFVWMSAILRWPILHCFSNLFSDQLSSGSPQISRKQRFYSRCLQPPAKKTQKTTTTPKTLSFSFVLIMTPFGPSAFGEAAEMMELSGANLGVALPPFVTSQRGNFQKRCSHLPRYFTAWRRTLSLNVDKMQFTHKGLLVKRIKQIKLKKKPGD